MTNRKNRKSVPAENAPGKEMSTKNSDAGQEPPVSNATDTPLSSKIGVVKDLLLRSEGASLDELTAATGWLPHTMRAALTGLRKKGHAIERFSSDGVTRWRIVRCFPSLEKEGDADGQCDNADSSTLAATANENVPT